MKICPHCYRTLGKRAVRCKYCRRVLVVKEKKPLVIEGLEIKAEKPPWSFAEVVFLWFFILCASFALDYFNILYHMMLFLRTQYSALTKEPALHYYIHIFTETLILKILAVVVIALILKMHGAKFIKDLKLKRTFDKRWTGMFLAFFGFSVLSRLVADTDPLSPNLPIYMFFKESSIIATTALVLSAAVVAPVTEEIFFRGFVYPGINKKIGSHWAVYITALLFTAVHIPQYRYHPHILFYIFLGGLFLTLARAITKSTWVTILLHTLYNSTIIIVGYVKYLILGY